MRIENKFKLAAAAVFSLMLLVAAISYKADATAHTTLISFEKSQEEADRFERLLTLLRDAETGQRGFLITGKENFLEPYYAAVGEIQLLLKVLIDDSDPSTTEKTATSEILRVAHLKLDEMAKTIAIRRTEGFAEVEPIVSSEHGKRYMDSLRGLIGTQVQQENSRRDAFKKDFEKQSSTALQVSLFATLINLALLALLLTVMFRLLREQQATVAALHETTDNLAKSIAEVDRRNEEMKLFAEMLQAIASVSLLSETSRIVAIYCAKLLPGISGSLYLLGPSRRVLEPQASWGVLSFAPKPLMPGDCWALQRGRAHHTRSANDLCCAHYIDDAHPATSRLCIPLVTQEKVIGMLFFENLATETNTFEVQQRLAGKITEHIALALSNVKLRETLRHHSIVDSLTGLFNRRYMDEMLKSALSHAQQNASTLSLVMIDLDYFKRVNDTFGHDAGDALLKTVAHQLRDSIREGDLACRFGGEELILILPECDLETATECAQRIRIAIAILHVDYGGRSLPNVTASFGVATFPQHGCDATTLLYAADQALYRAKHEGRNCVVTAAA